MGHTWLVFVRRLFLAAVVGVAGVVVLWVLGVRPEHLQALRLIVSGAGGAFAGAGCRSASLDAG
jgi:ABC-type enterobactin transport system permease subunit